MRQATLEEKVREGVAEALADEALKSCRSFDEATRRLARAIQLIGDRERESWNQDVYIEEMRWLREQAEDPECGPGDLPY